MCAIAFCSSQVTIVQGVAAFFLFALNMVIGRNSWANNRFNERNPNRWHRRDALLFHAGKPRTIRPYRALFSLA